jgi:hypothetical protein
MLAIKSNPNNDGTVIQFDSSDGSSLLMGINSGKAEIIEVKADDSDIRDALLKTAVAYASRRGAGFDNPPELKPTGCQSRKHHNVGVNGVDYDVVTEIIDIGQNLC